RARAPATSCQRRWGRRARTGVRSASPSLDVLDLLAQPLDFVLDRDHAVLDCRIVRLGTDRVRLAMHLLDQEAESLPDRLGRVGGHGLAEQREVRPQPDELLADVPALGDERDLARDPVLVDRLSL